jgi:hypothetical protein
MGEPVLDVGYKEVAVFVGVDSDVDVTTGVAPYRTCFGGPWRWSWRGSMICLVVIEDAEKVVCGAGCQGGR